MTKVEKLIFSKMTVFNTQDLTVLWQIPERRRLLEDIKYYLRAGKITAIRRGIYTLSQYVSNYSIYDLAQKIVPLSYISLSTALLMHGITFQYEETTHAIALISKNYRIDDKNFSYHKAKETIFFNQTGLIKQDFHTLAGPERAICDTLYIYPNYGFDNLRKIDMEKLLKISLIYKNKRLEREIKKLCSTGKTMK